MSTSKDDPVTGFMLPSPLPLPDESTAMGAELVMDPLDDGMLMPSLTDQWLSFKNFRQLCSIAGTIKQELILLSTRNYSALFPRMRSNRGMG